MDNINFNGISGKFEASSNPEAPSALILYSTLMDAKSSEKIAATLVNLMKKYDFSVMLLNLSSHPDSTCDNPEYLYEGSMALEYMQQQCPMSSSYYIIGHSFAAWVAMQLVMRRPEVVKFFLLSPMLSNINFSFLSPCPVGGLIIGGSNDAIVSQKQVEGFYDDIMQKQSSDSVQCHIIPSADHFFDAYLGKVRNIINTYMKDELGLGKVSKSSKKDKEEDDE